MLCANAQSDSLKIEELLKTGNQVKYTDLKKAKLNFEEAIKIINNLKVKDDYFLLKKALMLDRLGYYYRKETNQTQSLKALQESINIKKSINESFTLCDSYHLLGRLYSRIGDSVKTIESYNKSLQLAKKHKNNKGVVDVLNAYVSHCFKYKKYAKGNKYSDKAYSYADSIGYDKGRALALAQLAGYERKIKNYDKAIIYSNKDLEICKSINHSVGMDRSYKNLGYAYRKLKQPQKAVYYYEKSLALVREMGLENLLANRYLSLSNAYTDLKQHETAFMYYRLYKRQQIKDLNVKSIREFAELDAKYIYEKQKTIDSLSLVEQQKIKESKIREEASTQFWKTISIIAVLFGVLFTVIAFVLRRRKEQVELEKLQNEILQKEIEYKKKDLKHLAIDITTNKEWAQVLAEQLENIKGSTGRKRANELTKLETEIKNKIKVDENTEDFHDKIEVLSNSFYETLKNDFPKLTKNDIKLCSLIRLNMDTKQIATLQNINPSSVKMSRNRLRKKLNLTPNDDLYTFLTSY